jgi:hypothetical protein
LISGAKQKSNYKLSIQGREKTVINRRIISGLAIGISTFLLATLSYEQGFYDDPETDVEELQRLSVLFQERQESGQGEKYQQMLVDQTYPQAAINRNPNIQLMYVNDRDHPMYYTISNLNAARTISTDEVWPGGSGGYYLTGWWVDFLGIWDAGAVLTTHEELLGRVTQVDSPGGTHYHATHVAGTMIAEGIDSWAQGMAYEADLLAYDWSDDESEMADAAANGLMISNHSYGYITGWFYGWIEDDWYWFGDISISETEDYGFGFYGTDVMEWDQIVFAAPYYTIVKAAMNNRNDYGPDSPGGHYYWDGDEWLYSYQTRDPDKVLPKILSP